MTPTLIDTHCHLTFDALAPHVSAVLERARAAGVTRVITVSTRMRELAASLALLGAHADVYLAAGIHPHEAAACTSDDLSALDQLHRGHGVAAEDARRIVAVGETGLDFHYDFAPRERQEAVFRSQLEVATRHGRPVIIHARQAETRVADILAEYPALAGRAVFHCFSEGPAIARRLLDAGYYLSFTGVVTFKNAQTVREAARYAPLDRLLLETDAPFLSPEPVRKITPNEPAFVVHTARRLAELRHEPFETVAATTTANAARFFGLPEELP